MVRRGFGAVIRYILACVWILGATLLLLMPSPAPAAEGERGPARIGFGPEAFRFQVTVQDDGKDGGGGWLEATTTLIFMATPAEKQKWEGKDEKGCKVPPPDDTWRCKIKVGMPVTSRAVKQMSPRAAADLSARFASEARDNLVRPRTQTTAEFCSKFMSEMDRLFSQEYKGQLGQRVSSPS